MIFAKTKREMARAYSQKAGEYGRVRNAAFDAFLHQDVEYFSTSVKSIGNSVLDIGCGPGNESWILRENNLAPTCVDFSFGMAKECLRKTLTVCVADFYSLCFGDQTFSGVWMSFSLLHVPKSDVPEILLEIHRVLKPGGMFYLSLFEGDGEGLRDEDLSKYSCKRYFAYYRQSELSSLVSVSFSILKTARLNISPRPTISVQCRKI